MESYMQVDDMELAEVTVCEKGVNQEASFDILKASSGRPTKSCIDGSCLMKSEHTHNPITVLVKEDGNVSFLASLLNLVKDDNPFTNTMGKDDTELLETEAYRKREAVHHQLLDEQGFPAEVMPEQNRYIPTAEIELDENSRPIHVKPPWVVNEAGQDLGTSHANEALSPPTGTRIRNKPNNLQKFLGLSPQRKKSMIIEGHHSATDAFFSKTKSDEGLQKFPLATVDLSSKKDRSVIGHIGKSNKEKPVKKFLPLLTMLMGSGQASKNKIKKAQDNMQYAMFDDQRESSRPIQPRRKQVTTGDSAIPVLVQFTKQGATGAYSLENIEEAMASKNKSKLKSIDKAGGIKGALVGAAKDVATTYVSAKVKDKLSKSDDCGCS